MAFETPDPLAPGGHSSDKSPRGRKGGSLVENVLNAVVVGVMNLADASSGVGDGAGRGES